MAPWPLTGSKARPIAMQRTHVAYGGCWKCPHAWQRCSASTPCRAASQNGFVHSFGTGIGLVTPLQSLVFMASSSYALGLRDGRYSAGSPEEDDDRLGRRCLDGTGKYHMVSPHATRRSSWARSAEL